MGENIIAFLMKSIKSGAVAQLGEHSVRNAGVGGSNPLRSTILRSEPG